MTIEQIKKEMERVKNEVQEEFMTNLLDRVNYYLDNANKKEYTPTAKERMMFGEIVKIVNDINKWF